MDSRIQELIDMTTNKFGLHHYYLQRHSFRRDVNIFNETVYRFGMEWFPNHITEQEDDDSNPEGTAVIEVNLNTGKFESAIFVMGAFVAHLGILFSISIIEIIGIVFFTLGGIFSTIDIWERSKIRSVFTFVLVFVAIFASVI